MSLLLLAYAGWLCVPHGAAITRRWLQRQQLYEFADRDEGMPQWSQESDTDSDGSM